MKAQSAIEYFIIISIGLMIIIPYLVYSNSLLLGYKDDSNVNAAKNAVNKLGQNADWVFSQGEPAKITTEVFIPDGLTAIQFINNTIIFKVRTSAGISDIFYTSTANITGLLSIASGYYSITLSAEDGNVRMSVS
ncbi:MAG TPA: hypothetical protein VJH34_03830 [archaeon]|nr:hypothetical protein [archaeon]